MTEDKIWMRSFEPEKQACVEWSHDAILIGRRKSKLPLLQEQ
jgi:hypothetical protein